MFSLIAKFFKSKPKEVEEADQEPAKEPEQEPEKEPEKKEGGFIALGESFSTHRQRRTNIAQYIDQNAIPVKPDMIKQVISIDGSGMDFGGAVDSAKSAFVLNQQRIPEILFSWYVSQGFIGYQACGIIAQQWLVDKACTVKGEDAVRNGYNVTINDGSDIDIKVIAAINKADKKYKVKNKLEQASKFNEVFGIRHVLFLVDSKDKEYYEKPFNPDGIMPGTYRGISQIDPYWITPLLDSDAAADPASLYFYEPTYWVISGQKYHRSHFVILRGPEVTDILKPSYIYGGLPLTQRIMERVYAAERSANEAPILLMTKRLTIRKMDLSQFVGNQQAATEALAVQAELRDNHGFLAAGLDEEVEQLETALSDVDSVIMTQYQLVAAVANVPATRLLETSPKGWNSSGVGEGKNYQQVLETIQETDFTPIVDMHHICLLKSEIEPKFGTGEIDIDIDWNPTDMPTSDETAKINKTKAETAKIYMDTGALDAYDIRDGIIADRDSGYSGIESVDRPEELDDLEPDPDPAQDPSNGEPKPEQGKDGALELLEDPVQKPPSDDVPGIATDVLKEEGGKWYVYSEKGKKLGGPYSNKKKANNRLREIEYFKHNPSDSK
jgi:hypothetical protein